MAFRSFPFANRRRVFLNGPLLRALAQANQMLANGQTHDAANALAQVAGQMEQLNHPRRAANVHAQAAHAYADSRDEANALSHAQAALNLFLQFGMLRRASGFYANIVKKLRANGMNSAAETLMREFDGKAKAQGAPDAGARPRGRLPGKCPGCGAPVRSDEVDWIDRQSAECAYCGSVIQTES